MTLVCKCYFCWSLHYVYEFEFDYVFEYVYVYVFVFEYDYSSKFKKSMRRAHKRVNAPPFFGKCAFDIFQKNFNISA